MKINIPVDHHIHRKFKEAGLEHDTRVSHVSVDADSYAHFLKRIATDYTHISSEEQHALAVSTCLTHPDHRDKQKPVRIPIQKVKTWPWYHWLIIVIALLMALCFTTLARCQGTSQIDVITFKNAANTTVKSYAAPFTIKEGTGVTFSAAGSVMTVNAAGGAGGYTTIQSATVAITQRAIANFFGAIFCVDNAGATRSDCTLAANAAVGNQYLTGVDASGNFLRKQIAYGELSGVPATFAPTAHAILSASHSDTTAGAVARGDVITGQGASPTWKRLPKGSATNVLKMDTSAVDVLWGAVDFSELTNIPQFAQSGNCTGTDKFSAFNASNGLFTCTADVGAATPTGTGFVHVTAGAQDGAAATVDFNNSAEVSANQGTSTTVLHGNAAGQPAFGSVVQGDVTNGYVDQVTAQGAIGGNKIFTGNVTATSLIANNTGNGTNASIQAISGAPNYSIEQTGAPLDAKWWDMVANTTPNLQFRLINDAINNATNWLQVNRTGMTVDSLAVPEPLNVNGKTTVTGAISASTTVSATDFLAAGPNSCIDPTHATYGAKGDDATDDTAAMRAAIAAVPHGGCLNLGPRTYLITCGTPVSNACLTLAYPIEFRGSGMNTELFGSVLHFPNTVAATTDAIRLLSDANGDDGYYLHDFNIQCPSGVCGKSGILIDTTSFPISRLTISRVAIDGSWGSFGIRSANPTPLVNGFFTSTIGPENLINNGIQLNNAGDSIKIFGNTIAFGGTVTTTAGIDANFDVGAANFLVWGNNITQTKGGCIHLGAGALYPNIFGNFCEGGVSGTDVGSNGAAIDIDCTTGSHCKGVNIVGNIIQSVTTNINNVRVNFAENTNIHDNTITRPGGTAVDIITTANALSTNVSLNRWEPTTDVLANILTDAGTGTMLCLFSPQVPGMECNRPVNKTGQADIVADSGAINTTETIIVKTPALAANRLIVGTVIRIPFVATNTSTVANVSTFTLRMGTLGTTSDPAIFTSAMAASATSGTNVAFEGEVICTVRTIGASGTGFCKVKLVNPNATSVATASTGISVIPLQLVLPSMSTFNTTTAGNILSLSYKSAATTTTSIFKEAVIEIVYQ
jgi:hypothetical protein